MASSRSFCAPRGSPAIAQRLGKTVAASLGSLGLTVGSDRQMVPSLTLNVPFGGIPSVNSEVPAVSGTVPIPVAGAPEVDGCQR